MRKVILIGFLLITGTCGFVYWRWAQNHFFKAKTETSPVLVREKQATLIAIGDVSCAPSDKSSETACQFPKVSSLLKAENPDAILIVGDLQYYQGELKNFQAIFEPQVSDYKSKIYPVPGNHEYATKDATGYYAYWKDALQIPPEGRDPSKGYYSFNIKDWHLIGLNSNCEFLDGCDANSKQGMWLKEDLVKSPTRCSLAFWHHPYTSSGHYRDDLKTKERGAYFWNVLIENKADIIINGHDHLYERFARQNAQLESDYFKGARQFTVGTGGKSLYELHEVKAKNHEFATDKSFGYLKLDIYKTSYEWKFIDINGKVLDSGSSNCSI